MREAPRAQLSPKIKAVWRINDAIWITLAYLLCAIPFALLSGADPDLDWCFMVFLVLSILAAIAYVVFLAVLPPIRFIRWRYQISPEYLDIQKGIIWRQRYVIPFIRVQNTDTRQGPILRAFKLASVTVATAAGAHEIPGLEMNVAEELRDRAAEFARIAREDV